MRYRGHDIEFDEASGLFRIMPYGVMAASEFEAYAWVDDHIARESGGTALVKSNPKVAFKTKGGKTISFNARRNPVDELCDILEVEALENPKRRRKPAAKKKPAARKPAARKPAAARRSSKDKASYTYYVVFRGPPSGLNIHAGFATQKAARAFITSKFKGTKRLQVRGRAGLEKSGHDPKSAKSWKTFSLAASLKAAPAPRKRATAKAAAKKAPARKAGKRMTLDAIVRKFDSMPKLKAFYRDIKEMGGEALAERGILPATDAFALKVRSAIEDRFDEYDRDSAHAKKIFRHLQPNAKRSTRKPAARKPAARSRTRRNPDWASLTDAELNAELGRMDDAIEALEAKWDLYQHGYSAGLRKEAPKVQAEIMKMFEARAPIEEERNLRAAARRRGALANDFASAGRAGDTQSARTALLEYKSYLPRRNGGRGR